MSGVLIAGLAVGSMASGIGWGTVHWRLPLRRRLAAVLVLLTVCSLPLLLVADVWVMVPFVVLAGVAVSPSLISSFTLAELLVPRAAVTEAFTWIGTALGLGVAIGASVGRQGGRRLRGQRGLPGRHRRRSARRRRGRAVPAAAARAGRARGRPRARALSTPDGSAARGNRRPNPLIAQGRRSGPSAASRGLASVPAVPGGCVRHVGSARARKSPGWKILSFPRITAPTSGSRRMFTSSRPRTVAPHRRAARVATVGPLGLASAPAQAADLPAKDSFSRTVTGGWGTADPAAPGRQPRFTSGSRQGQAPSHSRPRARRGRRRSPARARAPT